MIWTIVKLILALINAMGALLFIALLASVMTLIAKSVSEEYPGMVWPKNASKNRVISLVLLTIIVNIPVINWVCVHSLTKNTESWISSLSNTLRTEILAEAIQQWERDHHET